MEILSSSLLEIYTTKVSQTIKTFDLIHEYNINNLIRSLFTFSIKINTALKHKTLNNTTKLKHINAI